MQRAKKGRPDIGRRPRIRNFQGLSWRSAMGFLPTKRVYGYLYFAGMLSNFPDASS
jgi:hypothetical protein